MKLISYFRLLIIICLASSLALVQPASISHAQIAQGFVLVWGDNANGEFGNGTTDPRSILEQVNGLTDVIQIAAGDAFSLALKSDGTVWGWGINNYGQLGDGTIIEHNTPVQVNGLTQVQMIWAGDFHGMALKSDGTVWTWGYNSLGQLGDGTTTERHLPVQVRNLSGVKSIGASYDHSLVIETDGTVWAWGNNNNGQLGDGTNNNVSLVPVQVSGLTGVKAIAAGVLRSLALKTDGTVWAWGNNDSGQLGDGTIISRSTPVQVSEITDISQIGAGYDHSLALKSDGTVWAWGLNYYGQLGDGTTDSSSTPVQVSDISGITSITAGAYHNLVLNSAGEVWAWGNNEYGQLGDGTTTNQDTPLQVRGLTAVESIAASEFHSLALVPATTPSISGNTGAYKTILNYTDGNAKSVVSDTNGDYRLVVPSGWSGTITPSKLKYSFSPANYEFTNLTSDENNQDFVATHSPEAWIVMNSDDSGLGSLREAIDNTIPGDTILFDASLAGQTIQLTSSLLITRAMTIDGSSLSPHIRIRGQNPDSSIKSIFSISNDTPLVTLNGLDIVDNYLPSSSGRIYPGGAIYNAGTLLVNGCNFDNNSDPIGGAIFNLGTLTVSNSQFTNNSASSGGDAYGYGGAIYNTVMGEMTVTDSTFSGNSVVGFGGAIYNAGDIKITSSTFQSNSARFVSGLIGDENYHINGSGGAVYHASNYLTINDSTFSQNKADNDGNGIYAVQGSTSNVTNDTFSSNGDPDHLWSFYNLGVLTITNNTISNNNGGVYNSGYVYLRNSILANNSNSQNPGLDCFNESGTVGENTNNLIMSNGSGSNACGTPMLTSDPLLGPLVNNGGVTQTLALPPNSPAIDVGNNSKCPATDQRGVPRPQGGICDLGAFELGKYAISGNAGAVGAVLNYVDGNPKSVTADGAGHYTFTIIEGWSGQVTPVLSGHSFSPPYRNYTNVQSPQTNQNYTAPPPIPVLSSPANAALSNIPMPTFSWTDSGTPSGYQLQYAASASFTNPVISPVVAPTNYTPSANMPQGTSYWQVRACDGQGVCSAWSNYRSITIDSIAPTNPNSVTESGGAVHNVWQNSVSDPNFTWSGATDAVSGVGGYYVYWGTSSTGVPSTWTTNPAYDPGAVSSPSIYYLRVQTKDVATNLSVPITLFTFKYDFQSPANPTSISSSNHTVNVWSNNPTVAVSWAGASDGLGSGIQGYSIEWDTSAVTLPDTVMDTTATNKTSPVLTSDAGWYMHLRTCDNAGNWSVSALNLGPFLIDTLPPSNPTVSSSSHSLSVWSADATVDVNWSGASDAGGSGINGYAIAWSESPTTLPAATVNVTGASTTSPVLSTANNWYFHIRTCDNVGNCAAAAVHYGPFYIDTDVPTGSIKINNGDLYTKNPAVTITLSATDLGIGVSQMQLSEGSTVYDWEPYNTTKSIVLSTGDGTKTVKVTYKDALGLVSQEYSAAILYDTSAPTSTITPLPGTSLIYDILVQWGATDPAPASGIATYDVQFKVGSAGAWTDWLLGTALTSTNFGLNPPVQLAEGTTYYFRVRATDKAGNVENYSLNDETTTWTIADYKYLYFPIFMR